MPRAEFGLLGPLEVQLDGQTVEIGSRKQRMVLTALLASPGRRVTTEALVPIIWGDRPPESVAVTLRSLVSRLRRALGECGDLVQADAGGYVAHIDPDTIDMHVFETLVARGQALLTDKRPGKAIGLLSRALALWRGAPLPDLADATSLRPVVERLVALRGTAAEDLAEAHLDMGDPAAALGALEPHLAADPLLERARGLQMLALYRLRRQTDALDVYRTLRLTLAEELGVEPHPDLRRLHQQILRQDRSLMLTEVEAGHLPTALTSLVGREADRDQVTALLRTSRWTTLTGVGGVGKSRLALQVASDLLGDFRDGVRLIELASVTDCSRVATRVAEALGVSTTGTSEDPLERITEVLRHQQLLMVVDNCEHVATAAATLIHRLLRDVPGLSVLATSRTPLHVIGEALYPVGPLSLPPPNADQPSELAASGAVELFCRRARDAQAGFGLTPDNAGVVAQICRRLDGLPLAVELAASRMRVLSTPQLLERLADRFQLLTTTDRNTSARQRTLRATIDWSYQLLTPAEQTALRVLTVFPADFDLDAASAVIGPTGTVDVVFELVDKSLVTSRHRSGRVRYELLESIGAFVREHAGPDELAAARERHRDHYAGLVARERRRQTNWDSVDWCRTVMAEEPNLREAISCALASGDADVALQIACGYWVYCLWGGRSEPLDWLGDAVAADRGHEALAHCEGMIALAVFTTWWELGSPQHSETLFERARRFADRWGDPHSRARARYFEAEYRLLRGRRTEARSGYDEAIRIAGDRGVASWCHHGLAWIASTEGDHERAIDELRRALQCGAPDELIVPHALAALAPLTAAAGRPTQAVALAERAVEAAAPFELPGIQVMALLRAGQTQTICLACTGHDTDSAEDALRRTLVELLDRLHRAGLRQFVAEALELTAVHAHRQDTILDAARYLATCDALRAARAEPSTCPAALTTIIDTTRTHLSAALGEPVLAALTAEAAIPPVHEVVADARRHLVRTDPDPEGVPRFPATSLAAAPGAAGWIGARRGW